MKGSGCASVDTHSTKCVFGVGCPCAACGHAAAAPPSAAMNSRRLMVAPHKVRSAHATDLTRPAECATESAFGHLRTLPARCRDVRFPPIATEEPKSHDVGRVPGADMEPLYSITSSAATSRFIGTVKPSDFAVFKLIASSKRVDCNTGKTPGFSPLTMRPV